MRWANLLKNTYHKEHKEHKEKDKEPSLNVAMMPSFSVFLLLVFFVLFVPLW